MQAFGKKESRGVLNVQTAAMIPALSVLRQRGKYKNLNENIRFCSLNQKKQDDIMIYINGCQILPVRNSRPVAGDGIRNS